MARALPAEFCRVQPLGIIVIIRDVSQRKELEKKVLEIASDERRRIGQELHDGTQQELTGLSLAAGTIENFFTQRVQVLMDDHQTLTIEASELRRLMSGASKLVLGLKEANEHVRSLAHGDTPVQIDAEGLRAALAELAQSTTVEGKAVCHFVHHGSLAIESNTVTTHLFGIAQEAINNAQRHGTAREVRVSLSVSLSQIQLEIQDDGVGMGVSLMERGGKSNRGIGGTA